MRVLLALAIAGCSGTHGTQDPPVGDPPVDGDTGEVDGDGDGSADDGWTKLWDSNDTWNNGIARTITGHNERDPYDPLLDIAAGDGRRLEILGNGHALQSGARARSHVYKSHYNGRQAMTYIHNPTLDNLSNRLRSRHDESGNRFGGAGLVIFRTEIELVYEIVHGGSHPVLDRRELPRPIPTTAPVRIDWSFTDVAGASPAQTQWHITIDYLDGTVFEHHFIDTDPPAVVVDRAAFASTSYDWVRTNNEDGSPLDIDMWDRRLWSRDE